MSRPLYYPYHDVFQTDIIFPQDSDFIFAGYPPGLPVPSGDHNGKLNSAYLWHTYIDQETIRNSDWLSSSNVALTTSMLTYTNGGNVTTTGATVATYASYLLNDNRIEIDDAALNGVGAAINGSPLIFPGAITPGRIWVYVSTSGQTRFESVAPATVDTPGVNEITLIGLDINNLGVVTNGAVVPVTLPLPDYQLSIITPIFIAGTNTMLSVVAGDAPGGDAAVVFDGQSGTGLSVQSNSVDPAAVFKQLGAGTALTAQGSIAVTVDLTVDGNGIIAGDVTLGAGPGSTLVTIGGDINDDLLVEAVSLFRQLATFNQDVVIGTTDTDALTIVSTATFQNSVNLGTGVGNKAIVVGLDSGDTCTVNAASIFTANINFGANTITGAGGTITTSTVNASVVVPTEVRYNTNAPGPSGNGRTGYDGFALTLGDGADNRRVHTPTEVYVVSDATVLAVEDITGASITMVIDDDQWVFFELSAAHVLAGADTFNALLAATNGVDNVGTLNSGDDDAASYGFTFGANQKITQSITVRWKPTNDIAVPNNTSWTIRVRHGVSGGNQLTTSNVHLEGWYEKL